MSTINRDDYRDALGWLRLTYQRDWEARGELAMATDPAGLVDALTDMLLGLANISTNGNINLYLDAMSINLESMLDRYDQRREGDQ